MALRHDPGGMRQSAGPDLILGFDARERWCPRDRLWPGDRRANYLLRPEVDRPLSADVLAWPSVFADPQLDLVGLDDLHLGSAGLPAPGMRGWVQDLWADLAALRAALGSAGDRAYDVIAITTAAPWHFDVPASAPAAPAADWQPLGYDVVDGWLLSGLTNCGYADHEDIGAWRRRWADRLNGHHLFDELEPAQAFAAATARRVREHAPFHACRIWKL
jgi:hypothetical protein